MPSKKKKGRFQSLDNAIIPVRNKDKRGHEKWTDNPNDIANFPSPSRILLIGNPGVGKSTMVKNLIMHQRPFFQEVYLIHEDAEFSKEYDDMELTEKMSELPSLDFWEQEGSYVKRAVIIDDLETARMSKEQEKRLNVLFRYCSTHKV